MLSHKIWIGTYQVVNVWAWASGVYEHGQVVCVSMVKWYVWAWSSGVCEHGQVVCGHGQVVCVSMVKWCVWAWSSGVYEHGQVVCMSMAKWCVWAWPSGVYEHDHRHCILNIIRGSFKWIFCGKSFGLEFEYAQINNRKYLFTEKIIRICVRRKYNLCKF